MRILKFEASNIKRIEAVEITPTGNLVEITGQNGAGKTSILDAIWWTLGGTKDIQSAPIHKGAPKGHCTLDLGEYVVTRSFRQKDGTDYTTTLTVESADGARFGKPQQLVDSFLGSFTFDPLEFARAKPKDQFDALKAFVPGVDFEKLAQLDAGDFAKRADLNRTAKDKAAAAEQISIPAGFAPIDESALVDEIMGAAGENDRIAERKRRREEVAERERKARGLIDMCKQEAEAFRQKAKEMLARADDEEKQAEQFKADADDLAVKLAEAPALPDPLDITDLRAKLDAAKTHNAMGARAEEKTRLTKEAAEAKAESETITERMAAREKAKRESIAAAKLPIDGVTFGEGEILLNGVPFNQASDAEQLRASIAIAMASNSKLRVIRVRDGSLLDENSMRILTEMAEAADTQVWIETIQSGRASAFVIEDGRLASTHALAAE